jgi:origin recognition complex subunit 3
VVVAEDEIRNMEETMPGAFESLVELQPGQLRSASQIILSQGEAFLAGLRTFQQKLAQTITAGTASMYDSKDDELVVAAMGDAAKHQREARLQRVQRKLLLEERLLGLKREITDWIVHYITELIDWKALLPSSLNVDFGPLHLLRNIYWVDCYGPLSILLDPSTRLNLTLPMSEPNEFLESLHETAFSTFPDEELAGIKLDALKNAEVPDICRMYQLYRECGKFVNLADWFEAFKQTVELDGTLKTVDLELNQDLLRNQATQAEDEHATGRNGNSKRRLRRNANSGSPVSDVLEEDGDTGVDDDDDADADIRDPDNSGVASTRTKRRSSRSGAQKRINLVESDYDSEVQDTPSKRRRRQQQGAQAQPASAAPAENGAVGDLQARFALALNELARMGMLRGTRRRQEHITKVMWDLVPDVL